MNNTLTVKAIPTNSNTNSIVPNRIAKGVTVNNCSNIVDNDDKSITFAATVHTTLPMRTASQGVSFAFYTPAFQLFSPLKKTRHV
jgi:hypothetical protein